MGSGARSQPGPGGCCPTSDELFQHAGAEWSGCFCDWRILSSAGRTDWHDPDSLQQKSSNYSAVALVQKPADDKQHAQTDKRGHPVYLSQAEGVVEEKLGD